jgi:hypothetical protein
MITIKEYIDAKGRNPYAKWFNRLNAPAAARVVTALVRMEQGNFSNAKSVGGVCWKTGSILDPDTAFILAGMVIKSSYCLAAAPKSGSKKT